MFTKEKLYTNEGGFVTEVSLPPFTTKPEVLIWGARVFIYVDALMEDYADKLQVPGDGYVEAWAYYVPPTVEEMPRRDLLYMIGMENADYGEPMEDRVYVPPELVTESCGCSLAPGYHFAACDIAKTALLNGTARQVYQRVIAASIMSEMELDAGDGTAGQKIIQDGLREAFIDPAREFIETPTTPEEERLHKLEALAKEHPEGAIVPPALLYHEFKVGEAFNCGWCFGGYTFTAETLSIPERGLAFCNESHYKAYIEQFPKPR